MKKLPKYDFGSTYVFKNRSGDVWTFPTKEEAKKNSRNFARYKLDSTSFLKFCSKCGKEFETCNEDRLFCDDCWKLRCKTNAFQPLNID